MDRSISRPSSTGPSPRKLFHHKVSTLLSKTRSSVRVAAALTGVALAVAACSSSSTSTASSSTAAKAGVSNTLTMGINVQIPTGLNPALWIPGNSNPYFEPAYDSLLYLAPSGQYLPDLATSWGFVGSGSKQFDLTIRSGVHFSDGSLLTPAAVAGYIKYYKSAGGASASNLASVQSVDVTGPSTVAIHLSQGNPDLPYLLSQNGLAGDIVSPQALKNPSSLKAATDGAGPYELAPSQTIALQTYTYVPNPHYWDPSAVKFQKFVLKVITEPNAMLSSLQSGQIQAALGTTSTASSASSAGFNVISVPTQVVTVVLGDRTGQVSKALSSLQVRQALNLAVDRAQITQAVFGKYGVATDEVTPPGGQGYSSAASDYYPYDLSKAKQLLQAAGYGSGFTLPMACFTGDPTWCEIAQALQAEWSQIGVNVKLSSYATPAAYTPAVLSKKFPATLIVTGNSSGYINLTSLNTAGMTDPWGIVDPAFSKMLTQVASSTSAQIAASEAAATDYVVKNAWFVPVGTESVIYFVNKNIQNVAVSAQQTLWDPFSPIASYDWK